MAVYGPSMINSDKGGVELGAILIQICDRVDSYLEKIALLEDGEQPISADLEILRVLCERYPRESATALTKAQVEKWKEEFVPWLEKKKATLPKEYRDKIVEASNSDLEALASLAVF